MDRLSRVVKIDARLQGEMSMKGLAVLSLGGGVLGTSQSTSHSA
jgi:hypothetical protein